MIEKDIVDIVGWFEDKVYECPAVDKRGHSIEAVREIIRNHLNDVKAIGETVCFSIAIDLVKIGYKITRKKWKTQSDWVGKSDCVCDRGVDSPFLFREKDHERHPWFPTNEDMFAEDWIVFYYQE